jgi:glycopeptide antibiotics resistance protein
MTPFLIDVTGNTLDLYDSISWWDDANHFVNWFLLCLGLALVLDVPSLRPAWARAIVVIGGGALLALLWELGEWYAFIRHGTELDTAYEDTLGDMTLGTCGAVLALVVTVVIGRRRSSASARSADTSPGFASLPT